MSSLWTIKPFELVHLTLHLGHNAEIGVVLPTRTTLWSDRKHHDSEEMQKGGTVLAVHGVVKGPPIQGPHSNPLRR